MENATFDKIYKNVPREQKEQLLRFRSTHPYKHLTVETNIWQYIFCGQGKEALTLLAGGLSIGEAWFQIILALEQEYQIIAPTYPPATTMAQLIDGVASILESEGIRQVNLLGASMGGMVAQCFVRRYPEKVSKLILANTMAPNKAYAERLGKSDKRSCLFPIWLMRIFAKYAITKHLSAVASTEREFWRAYFNEFVSLHWSRESILRQNSCVVDFAQNYEFTPNDLANWPGRILIIESDDDRAVGAFNGRLLKDMNPHAQVHTFHNAGHASLITRREEYIATVKKFLKAA